MSVAKFRGALGSGTGLLDFFKAGAWRVLIDGNLGYECGLPASH